MPASIGTVGLRVLVVEDEALIAEELQERLTRLGMIVVAAVDSADLAIESAISKQPDLILMDVRLKGKGDGISAADAIRQRQDIPVVFLTAHSDRATIERAKRGAPFGYVLKPFHERELLVAIEMAVHRHALESQLKESERKYAATLASIGDAVIATDLADHITFMNPVAEALTGWTFAEAQLLPLDAVLHLSSDARGERAVYPMRETIRERRTVRFGGSDLFLITRHNEVIPLDDCATPIADAHGEVTGAVMAFRDIRDRLLTEDALKRAQDELFQAQKMESVGRLAAGIAHDFNNLLTVINGCAELALTDENLSETTRTLLKDIVKAGARAASLTGQFLAFGRRQLQRPDVLDLNQLVTDLDAILRRLIRADIHLAHALAIQPVLAYADPTQIEQMLVNLVINARDAMTEAGTVTITTAPANLEDGDVRQVDGEPGPYVLLAVSDTGPGIDEAIQRKIFEPYFTTKQVDKGSGLGLATVYGIAKQAGGFVQVDSTPGLGATFNVYLPAAQGSLPVEGTVHHPTVAARGGETILLVEDEGDVRALVSRVLRRNGYQVLKAGNGEEALLVSERHAGPLHLVVTDVVMPDLRGPQLVARLKERQPGLRVMYMSGYSSDAAQLSGDAPFMQKPFTADGLVQKVREVLDH
jgi:two-component system, cell cycle sensor histidine kinase and response regulator CckA